MASFSVDPGQLRQAVSEAARAVAGLEEARARLDWSNGHVQEGAGGKVADRFDGFRKRWQDEFRIISEFLGGMEQALTATADMYETVDAEIAGALSGPST